MANVTDSQVYDCYVAYCRRIGVDPAPPEHYLKVTASHNTVVNYMPQKNAYAGKERAQH